MHQPFLTLYTVLFELFSNFYFIVHLLGQENRDDYPQVPLTLATSRWLLVTELPMHQPFVTLYTVLFATSRWLLVTELCGCRDYSCPEGSWRWTKVGIIFLIALTSHHMLSSILDANITQEILHLSPERVAKYSIKILEMVQNPSHLDPTLFSNQAYVNIFWNVFS